MKEPPAGIRVGAMAFKTGGTIFLLGYGIYVGDEVPSDEGGGSMTALFHALEKRNPKIVLDNGDIVWGCECWWGSEADIKKVIHEENLSVVEVTVSDLRAGRLPHVVSPAADDFWSA